MSSLNEHEKLILEDLLNRADVVAPSSDKPQEPDRNNELDHEFHFLDRFINNDMDESMQFEQQTPATGYVNQQPSQQLQHTPDTGSTGSSYQGQGSSGFSHQQTGFAAVASGQSNAAGFQGQGHGFQQVQQSQTQGAEMNVSATEGFQNQTQGFQQQFPMAGAIPQSGQLEKPGSLSSGFSNQSSVFPQQYSMETSSSAQNDLASHVGSTFQTQGASYQPQTQTQFNDSSRHLQAQQQQVNQNDSAYPNSLPSSSKEQVSLSPAVYQNQNSDCQQQAFLGDYNTNNGTNGSSLQAVGQTTGYQQQYPSGSNTQPTAERRDSSQQQAIQKYSNQVAGYQQQPQPAQQQALYQQGNHMSSSSSTDQTYQSSTGDGASMCFSDALSGYSQQTGQQQQQGTMPTNPSVDSPGSLQASCIGGVQHTQFQSSNAQADQASAGTFQGQVSHFPKQQSFHSPAGSPAQPAPPVGGSPASYAQPSPDPHHTYNQSGPASVQSDQNAGLSYTGQTTGYSKQVAYQSSDPNSEPGHVEGSLPNSPGSNYQHQSPGYSVQSPYTAPGQSRGQGDQNTAGSFSTHTGGYSQSMPNQGDQNAVTNFQNNAVYSNSTVQEDPEPSSSFQTPGSLQSQCSSPGDSGVRTQTNDYQQPLFQSATHPAASDSVTAQPMQEGSGPSSMEADVVAFLHETLQSVNQPTQNLDVSSTAVSYQQMSATQTPNTVRRDQPMETQQSPYMVGSGSSTGAFHSQSQALTQQSVFQEPVVQVSQAAQPGTGFLNQTLPFQGQGGGFPVSAAMPAQSLPMPLDGLLSGSAQSQNRDYSSDKLSSSSYSDPSSGSFGTQTVLSSGQSTRTTFPTVCTSVLSSVQNVASAAEASHFNQHTVNTSSFSQFPNSAAPTFGHDSNQLQVQQQHLSLPSHQQPIQQSVFTSQPQTAGIPLMQNSSSHDLSALVKGDAQMTFQTISSSATLANQTPPVSVFGNQQYGAGQLSAQQVTQQGVQNLASIIPPSQVSSVPNPVPFAQSTSNPVQSPAVSTNSQSNLSTGKSAAACVQDSSQTSNAISLLTTVLQQIQAILPQFLGQQQNIVNPAQPVTPSGDSGDSMFLERLLQSQNGAQQVLQLLQQQQSTPTQQISGQSSQQIADQDFALRQQQKPSENFSTAQQPNFLMQQSGQQQLFLSQQQQQTQQQQAVQSQSQQVISGIPSFLVSSLARTLQSQGVTIVSDSQVMAGQQSVKFLLGSASGSPSLNMVQTSGDGSTVTPVSLSGLTGLSGATSQAASPGGLPMDLQNIHLSLFTSAAASSSSCSSMTHTSDTTPTAAPHSGSNISKNTTVIPTSSFTQPLPVAGVGLGVAAPSSTVETVSANSSAFPAPSSEPQLATSQNVAVCTSSSTSTISTPSVANIFFPVSSASLLEKRIETSMSSTPSSMSVGNFLNVTTGSASMLLNAFSMAVADGKSENTGFKMGNFSVPDVPSSEDVFGNFTQQNHEKGGTSAMDVAESVEGTSSGIKPMDTDKPLENLTPRHSSRKTSIEEELDMEPKDAINNSMLRRILTMKDEDGNLPNSKAPSPTPGNSPVETPSEIYVDGNTQATLIEKSEKLRLSSEVQQDDDMQPEFWTPVTSFPNTPSDDFVPSKVQRGADDLDASSKHVGLPSVEKLFDAGGATSNSAFVFTKFGAEDPGVRTFGSSTSETAKAPSSSNVSEERMSGIASAVKPAEPLKLSSVPTASIRPSTRRQKDPALTFQFPPRVGEYELRILAQPEEQHRARYLTEGSRGAVKDRSQQSYPIIKLNGYAEPTTLQVFIGSETGRVKPHGFYQACKVCGKNSTHCTEREIDGTNVIEIDILPANDMQVNMDCVGILKLRNADVEKRIGPTKAKAKKKNSTKARLVFRTTLRKPDGSFCTLQVASTPILCTQPIGQPEISRLSVSEICVNQTKDLFIIGKNFLKGTRIMFQELSADERGFKWESEAEIEVEYFQQTHLICRVPEYPRKDIERPVQCQIVAISGGKVSDPQDFIYTPAKVTVKEENEMDTEPAASSSRVLPFGVSPVALQLNRLVERTQHNTPSSTMFQLPPGAIPNICNAPTLPTPPRVVSSTPTQPVSSILKPATLCLPASGHALTLGEGKGGVPVQFVLPSHGVGSAVPVDSRQLGNPPAQLVLMSAPQAMSSASGGSANNKGQQPVFSLTSLPSSSPTSTPAVTVAGSGGGNAPVNTSTVPTPSSSAPMIVFLAGPPTTSSSAVPNQQQAINSGQVESLLKQMLESSKSSSS